MACKAKIRRQHGELLVSRDEASACMSKAGMIQLAAKRGLAIEQPALQSARGSAEGPRRRREARVRRGVGEPFAKCAQLGRRLAFAFDERLPRGECFVRHAQKSRRLRAARERTEREGRRPGSEEAGRDASGEPRPKDHGLGANPRRAQRTHRLQVLGEPCVRRRIDRFETAHVRMRRVGCGVGRHFGAKRFDERAHVIGRGAPPEERGERLAVPGEVKPRRSRHVRALGRAMIGVDVQRPLHRSKGTLIGASSVAIGGAAEAARLARKHGPAMHIVVTGASSGIGRALAQSFDKPGNVISLVARRRAHLEELRRELHTESVAIVADLSRADDPVGWLKRAEERNGPTDVLVNNAGTSYVEPTVGVDAERVQKLFQINVHTPLAAIHHVLPAMLARSTGTIVNIASNAAFSPAPGFAHYSATKGALANFSESLRMELRKTGVHVLTVYPGPIHTPMAERNYAQLEGELAKLGPIGDTQTLARLVQRAIERRRARVIYPRFYTLGWWFPFVGRWVAELLLPSVTGQKTPPLEGDLL